jgi:hypothetical protein
MVPEAPRNRGCLAGTIQQVRERRLNRQAHGGLEKRIKEFVGRGIQLLSDTKLNGVATPVPSIPGPRLLTAVSFSRTLTELLPKPTETALVNHVVKWHLFREQSRCLNAQVKPLDVYLAVGALACNDQKAEPVDMALEISIGLLAGLRDSI